ncbi:GntR family transcriptional regulator [Halostella sp. JP-L12]|uniref:helix-turn-helix transcriptional regulator n=1 Tax=Halostella TaxID=1843185 RepID=UPI000EF7A696|nr:MULTISPECIES: GntR family transcriptional regulator [Halostella]NHN46723.1 GntR family transcriptional regulator [Halostella sp. JP-L12]
MGRDAVSDLVRTLCNRHEFLVALRVAPREKRALVETLGVSRSTVDRALRELADEGLVARTDRGYRLTSTGRLAASLTDAMLAAAGDLRAVAEPLRAVSSDAPLDLRLVGGATAAEASERVRSRPLSEVRDLFDAASRVYVLAPVISQPRSFDRLCEAVLKAGTDVEMVLEASLAEQLFPPNADRIATMVDEGFTPLVTTGVPFGLVLGETDDGWETHVVTYGDDGELQGVVSNDTPAAAAWAWETYQRYRADAADVSDAVRSERQGRPVASE